jgi:hypothetical protein
MVAAAVARALAADMLSLDELCEIGDDVLLWRLRTCADPAARRLAEALAARALWKTAYILPYTRVLTAASPDVETQDRARARNRRSAEALAKADHRVPNDTPRPAPLDDLMKRFHSDPAARIAVEDRLAADLGLDPGDILIHSPHHRMAMKSATTLVYWNGDLRPLKDCSEDPLIGARLQAILDSHQHLWSLRVFANPARLNDKHTSTLAAACAGLFGG